MTTQKKELKDRVYRLKNGQAPLSFILPNRDTHRYRLLYFDEEKGVQRALRYARNQKSPFEDEQDQNVILETIVFEDGMLFVPRENQVLQKFLSYHPMNGKAFEEVDKEMDAQREVEEMMAEVDALSLAKEVTVEQMEAIARAYLGVDPSIMTTAELKRDILVFAKKDPLGFIDAATDSDTSAVSDVHRFFSENLLSFRSQKREIWFNTPTNKKRMLVVPFAEDPYKYCTDYFKTDEGVEIYEMLKALVLE
jgi:hypothetical protein